MELDLQPPLVIPNGPAGTRVVIATTGKAHGPEFNGEVVGPSADWLTVGPDGSLVGIDLKAVIKTDDGELIYIHVVGRSMRDSDNPANAMIRAATTFEASISGKYKHVNNKMVFGHGTKTGSKIKIDYYDTSGG